MCFITPHLTGELTGLLAILVLLLVSHLNLILLLSFSLSSCNFKICDKRLRIEKNLQLQYVS